ncbi:hypothetical protein KUTeg_020274 [Tegillarca granosa]|uniref:BTB domain-containing protein n=1 Tax=Tegillarca granosa TaxID=220873 RepID=A0ABQ9ECK5_TEGGR|nr:hypothetical protein KUTeg_020274 [Tegillarca granosa]
MNKKSDNFLLKDVENGLKISNKHAGTRLIKGICDLWHHKHLCDIVIKCNGEEIQAHKTVLAIHSDYFRAMFTAGFEESSQQQSVVTMNEALPRALKLIIDYMYTGNITVNKESVQDVVVLADLLQMSDLKKICCKYMETLLDVSNCLGVWDFSEKYSCTELLDKSLMLLKQRFLTVCQMEEFLLLSADKLKRVLGFQDLYLGIEGESSVLDAVFKWLEYDTVNRITDFCDVIKLVKLKYVCRKVLKKFMDSAVVRENKVILETVQDQLVVEESNPREAVRHLYVIGGYLQSRTG